MDIEELEKAKESLESGIYQAVDDLLSEFKKKTGRTPDDISIHFESIPMVTDPGRRVFAGVMVTIIV